MIRIGTIGLGKMGILHSGILNSLDNCRLVAIADPQPLVRKYFSQCCPNILTYEDYRDLLQKEDIDVAVIATPTYLHSEIGRECAKAHVSFLVEKPLGTSAEDARSLLDEVKTSKVSTEVGYACVRFVPTFQRGFEFARSSILGNLRELHASAFVTQVTKPTTGWQFTLEKSGGGVLNNFASHMIYLLYWYFGRPSNVACKMDSKFSLGVEDSVTGKIHFDGGIPTADFEASWSTPDYPMPQLKVSVKGDNGTLTVTDYFVELNLNHTVKPYSSGRTRFYRQDLWEGVEFSLGGPEYCREDRHLIDCVKENKSTLVDAEVGYDVQKIIGAMYDSNTKGGACDISW